ncbi:MAG: pilus assembly protein PilM, partial [Candidatus Omnitrophota bacterium]|nr:pilus assembly protein PilM [Candidatus Omnitrophota bacterium]
MNSLGIYFGTNTIGLVESKGKKLVNNVVIPQVNISAGDFEEKVPVDIKMIALLKDAFRTYRINSSAATICLSGQDLIIRTFEIPTLPQNELRSAINFEVKKYIPFKLEELVYDFQVESNKNNKTSMVLFVGAKKEVLDGYISVSNQLNLKVNAIEYSAFSLQRFLRLSGVQESGVAACLCFDLNNEDEINFMVFKDGFPLFTRDI